MEYLNITSTKEDPQLPLKDEQAGDSQTLPEQILEEPEEYKLACALTKLTLEVFTLIAWEYWEKLHFKCLDVFNSFKDQVFDAMAYYAWNLYDKEDLENILCVDDVYGECESIWKLICFDESTMLHQVTAKLDSSLLDISLFEKVREQDLCNLFWWSYQNPRYGYKEKEFSNFKRYAQLYVHKLVFDNYKDFGKYVRRASITMRAADNLDPRGMSKKQLRIELVERQCLGVSDALFMQSWNRINLEELEAVTPSPGNFQELIENVYRTLHFSVRSRQKRLDECQTLVTYPLSSKVYGSWDDEVVKVIKLADLKRRSEERRFIGTDHLLFYLHQMLLSETPYKLEQSKFMYLSLENFNDLSCDTKVKHSDTIYHLYPKAFAIAAKLGDQTIGLEHLYAAITSGDDDDEGSWKLFVECARMAKAAREGISKVEDVPHTNPWNFVIANSWNENIAKDIRKRKINKADVLPAVKRMKDKNNIPLHNAIFNLLDIVDERTEMTEGEVLYSLRRIIFQHQCSQKRILHKFVKHLAWTPKANCNMMAAEPIEHGLRDLL